MGSRGDRVGDLIVKERFKVTALRFSPASLSDPSANRMGGYPIALKMISPSGVTYNYRHLNHF